VLSAAHHRNNPVLREECIASTRGKRVLASGALGKFKTDFPMKHDE
jgi:hypothetical protein